MCRTQWIANCACLVGVLLGQVVLRAEMRNLDATADTTVLQTLGDGTVNSDHAFKDLTESTPNLPLAVRSHLQTVDLATFSLTSGTSTAVFSDPRTSQEDNPREFAVGATLFSFDPSITYGAVARAVEARTVAFTASEIGEPDGTALQVTSHFFLGGYLAVWGDLGKSAGTSSVLISIRIEQSRSQDASPFVLMDAHLELSHDSNGRPVLTADGGLSVDNVVLDDTLGSVIPLGQTYLVTIPEMTLPYRYGANVGEEFTLKAEVQCRLANQPFTGAGASFGRPLDDFLAEIADAIGGPLSNASTTALARSSARQAIKPLSIQKDTTVEVVRPERPFAGLSACGGVGIEALLFSGAFPAMLWMVRRRP